MSEPLLGVCRLRSIGNKKDDRKAGITVSSNYYFSVTSDKKILVYEGTEQALDYAEFENRYHVLEPPRYTITQRRLERYKAELKEEKVLGRVVIDYRYKIKQKGKEEIISFKQVTRSSAIKTILREFKNHDEIFEWFSGDWLLIKRMRKK